MISILIPIYNFNGIKLVEALHAQGAQLGVPFEILLVDDHSPFSVRENEQVNRLPHAVYAYLAENLGRSKIRNWLAQKAKHPFLLFIDGDMALQKPDFLKNYLALLSEKRVICGGHYYAIAPPENKTFRLHWVYGRTREVRTALDRNSKPCQGFVPSNFIIPKEVFLGVKFDESIKGYGHEDTLFGAALCKQNIEVLHIDNGLIHLGLEPADVFLNKTDLAIQNLVQLENRYNFNNTRLQKAAKKYYLLKPFLSVISKKYLRRKIKKTQNLKLLDLYKLKSYFRQKK